MGSSEALRDAIDLTYHANVQNELRDVLISDLIRLLAAIVLDDDVRRAGSICTAIHYLRNSKLLIELEKDYRVIPPLPSDNFEASQDLKERETIQHAHHDRELQRNLEIFSTLLPTLDQIERDVLETDIASAIRKARNKAIAHYEVVRDGNDFRMWRLESAGLTFDQLNKYVDSCTEVVNQLYGFVLHKGVAFEMTTEIARKDVGLYIDALVNGLHAYKADEPNRRAAGRRKLGLE